MRMDELSMVMVLFLLIYIFTSVLTFCVYADGRVVDGDDVIPINIYIYTSTDLLRVCGWTSCRW